MKIAFLMTDCSLQRGSERVTASLANALVKHNHVSVISLYQQNKSNFYKIDKNIQAKTIYKEGRTHLKFIKFFQKVGELWGVAQTIRKSDVDIWIGTGTYCAILLGIFRWLNPRKKYLAWEHSSYNATTGKWKKLRNTFYKKLDAVICLNATEQKHYQQEFSKVFVIPNVISFYATKQATLTTKRFLSIGGLEEEKGFDLLIEAFYHSKINEWDLQIIGSGSKKNELEILIQKYELQNRVKLIPFAKHIEEFYINADIYVLPSKSEGFGMVLIEAMECGLPCIAFDCPTGPAHLIANEINGLLVPANDIIKLGEAMALLAENKTLARNMAAKSKDALQNYREEVILPLWFDVFKWLYS